MDKGWIPECSECRFMENNGETSDRQFAETVSSGEPFEYWDLELNNTCNLACRMCGPRASSTFQQNVINNSNEDWDDSYKHFVKKTWFRDENMKFILDKIIYAKHVKFTGGEPMLIPQVGKIIDHLISQGVSKNIYLKMISNGTQPMDRWIDRFKYFDRVEIDVSVDAIGERFEYIRPGAKWKVLEKNVKDLIASNIPNLTITITTFPMLLNYEYLHEVEAWANSLGLEYYCSGYLTNPDFLSVHTANNKELQKKFIKQMEIQDRIHGTDWRNFVNFQN